MKVNEITGLSLLQFFRGLAIITTAIDFAVDGFYFIFLEDPKRSKGRKCNCLIIVIGAFTLAEIVNNNIKF